MSCILDKNNDELGRSTKSSKITCSSRIMHGVPAFECEPALFWRHGATEKLLKQLLHLALMPRYGEWSRLVISKAYCFFLSADCFWLLGFDDPPSCFFLVARSGKYKEGRPTM